MLTAYGPGELSCGAVPETAVMRTPTLHVAIGEVDVTDTSNGTVRIDCRTDAAGCKIVKVFSDGQTGI
jgi:hypothetical protein